MVGKNGTTLGDRNHECWIVVGEFESLQFIFDQTIFMMPTWDLNEIGLSFTNSTSDLTISGTPKHVGDAILRMEANTITLHAILPSSTTELIIVSEPVKDGIIEYAGS